ncbi:hypothetical protein [Bradyrhizobium sp. DASA03007]|uniref:hypothetical protein n=1 Tax=unclassified Bradyrhizobium TaxID=2631580 RepID=UPI003F6E7FE3
MEIRTTITGTKPLLLHNIQLANPDNVWAKRIAEISKKRKKTEDDRRDMARLEWMGSLYVHDNQIVMPTANVLKSFLGAAKITKEGKSVSRALSPLDIHVPLIFTGPQTPEELLERDDFRDQTLVTVGTSRVVRTRPIFRNWAVVIDWELMTEVLDFDAFEKIVKLAGRVEGLGDNRVNGWGRYETKILVSEVAKEAA